MASSVFAAADSARRPSRAVLGVVVGAVRFSYFHELFERLNLDPDDVITA